MVITSRMDKLYDDGIGDRNFYRITNDGYCSCYTDGDHKLPGLNVQIKYLTRETWDEVVKGLYTYDQLDFDVRRGSIADDAMSELLYLLLTNDDGADIGWKITMMKVDTCGGICMCVEAAGTRTLKERLDRRVAELRHADVDASNLTSWLPPDAFLVYWSRPRACQPLTFQVKIPDDETSYTFVLHSGSVVVEEEGDKHCRRLEFINMTDRADGTSIADVIVTEARK